MEAERALLVDVGGDLNHESTTMTTKVDLSHFQRSETTLGRKALFHVKGEDGQLQLLSNNLNAKGADIVNDGNGNTLVQTKNNMNLTALSVGFDEKMGKGNHYRHEKVEEAVVSQVKGKGNVLLTGKNILSEGAQLESEAKLMAIAENDLVLNGAKESRDFEEFHKTKSGSVAKVTKTSLDQQQSVTQVGTQVSGKNVVLSAGHDVKAKGFRLLRRIISIFRLDMMLILQQIPIISKISAWKPRKPVVCSQAAVLALLLVQNQKSMIMKRKVGHNQMHVAR